MPKLIYISGPYSGSPEQKEWNVRYAIDSADWVLEQGGIPFIPHLSHLWDKYSPKSYSEWMRLDLAYLERCDAVFRLPGNSPGGDVETESARLWGKPVFTEVDALREWLHV